MARDYYTGKEIDGPRIQFGNRHGDMVIRIQAGDGRYKTIVQGDEMNFEDINSFTEWFIERERSLAWQNGNRI